MFALLHLIDAIVQFYRFVLIAQVILNWLVTIGAVDRYNRIVVAVGDTLYRLTEPVLRPVRNMLDRVGLTINGIDLSPLIVFFLLGFIPEFLYEILLPAAPYIR